MLTNLTQIDTGSYWPPNNEIKERMRKLYRWEKLFEGDHDDMYAYDLRRVCRTLGISEEIYKFNLLLNYHRKISIKTVDLMLGETPDIELGTKANEVFLDELIVTTDYWNTMCEAVIDVSRYGCSVLKVSLEDSKPCIDIVPAKFWIPIVSPLNQKRIVNHLIAWSEEIDKKSVLTVQIHYKGYYDINTYELEVPVYGLDPKIGKLLLTERIQTGLNDFAIVVLSNVTSSSSIYGISDYSDIDSIISELEVRVSQWAKILDANADPSVILPESAIKIDPATGVATAKMKNAFIQQSKDDVKPEYMECAITSTESMVAELSMLKKELANISEMGPLINNDNENLGQLSGTAIKKLYFAPLSKVARLTTKINPGMIKVLKLASQLYSKDLSSESLSIAFRDGLPTDMTEVVTFTTMAVAGGVMSKETALKFIHDGADDEFIQKELALIKSEEVDSSGEVEETSPVPGASGKEE
jgi:hypothetical protein